MYSRRYSELADGTPPVEGHVAVDATDENCADGTPPVEGQCTVELSDWRSSEL